MKKKDDKDFFVSQAKVISEIIIRNREEIKRTGEKVEIVVLKKDKKRIKRLFDELLNEDSSNYIIYVIRKRSEAEKHILFIGWCLIVFLLVATLTIIGILFGWLNGDMAVFAGYLMHSFGFVLGLYLFTQSLREKAGRLLFVGLLNIGINGIFMWYSLSVLY